LLSAIMPLLFCVRWYLNNRATTHNPFSHQEKHFCPFDILHILKINHPENVVLQQVSDVAELYYCNIQDYVDSPLNFTTWAMPFLNDSLASLARKPELAHLHSEPVQQEFVLQLLEVYAYEQGRCNLQTYQPAAVVSVEAAWKLQAVRDRATTKARIAYTIVAYRDFAQLQRLVEAIHEPFHYIVLHLERTCATDYSRRVRNLAKQYDNVVVVQFGTIVYRTDSVSMVNLRIMRWLTDLNVPYEFHITLGGAAFPLVKDVSAALTGTNRQVWLGEMTHRGAAVRQSQTHLLRQKRLIFTRGEEKIHKRLSKVAFANYPIPDYIENSMIYKTASGNQAIFSRNVVRELLASKQVLELFVLSKYGCCCCLEERNWIAALEIIGRGAEAREQAAMFQVWGGIDDTCRISMRNSVLTRNESVCFRSEDNTGRNNNNNSGQYHFFGNQTWEVMLHARKRGMLFARKFDSEVSASMDLLRDIKELMWEEQELELY
jgi:hypothetical protein